jgi:hypothetical protein
MTHRKFAPARDVCQGRTAVIEKVVELLHGKPELPAGEAALGERIPQDDAAIDARNVTVDRLDEMTDQLTRNRGATLDTLLEASL